MISWLAAEFISISRAHIVLICQLDSSSLIKLLNHPQVKLVLAVTPGAGCFVFNEQKRDLIVKRFMKTYFEDKKKKESTSTDMSLGMSIQNIEITLGNGEQLVREPSAIVKLITKEGKLGTLKLPSREVYLISRNCLTTSGQVRIVGGELKEWIASKPAAWSHVIDTWSRIF